MTGPLQTPVIKVLFRKAVELMGISGRASGVRRLASSACLAAGIGGILIACGAGDTSDSSSPSPTTNDVTNGGTSVGPEGGTITENGVTVTIPTGALAASTPIHITESTVVPNGYTVSGKVYRFEPSGTHFSAPITIALPSTKPEIVYWTADGSETEFEPIETEFDEVATTAKVQITHFSSAFVGTTPNGITCIVKQPSGCPGTKTTIESPSFWYTNTRYWSGAYYPYRSYIATNSIGVNRYMNSHAGEGVLTPNADRSIWKTNVGSLGDPGTAYVSQDIITNFTAKASRGGVSAGTSCGLGNGSVHAPTVDYTCSGGNVRIGDGPPRTPVDAGVSTDSGLASDASTDLSAADSSVADTGTSVDSSVEDAGTTEDSSVDDSSVVADSGTEPSDSGAVSGIADSGVADSSVPNGITCTVIKLDAECNAGAVTTESNIKFWYVNNNPKELASDSPGLNYLILRSSVPSGKTLYYSKSATNDFYTQQYSYTQAGVALVSNGVITSFTADSWNGSPSYDNCVVHTGTYNKGPYLQFSRLVKCSGGNVKILSSAP